MPDWLVALISVAASTAVSTTVAFVLKSSFTKYLEKKEEEKKENEKNKAAAEKLTRMEEQEKLIKTVNDIVEKHTEPIDKELEGIRDKLGKVADGTMDTLRDRILSSYYKCYEKGYRTQYDIDNVEHMNKDYLALNGNTFVAECMEKFKHIPTEKEYAILKAREEEERKSKKKSKRSKGSRKVNLSIAPAVDASAPAPAKKEE